MSFFTALFRRDASDTSIEAAKSLDVTSLEFMVLNAIRKAGAQGMTQDELLQKYPKLSYSSVTARPAALKRKGLIADSGERRKGKSGRNQAVLVSSEFAPAE
jgi:hypothetical protein